MSHHWVLPLSSSISSLPAFSSGLPSQVPTSMYAFLSSIHSCLSDPFYKKGTIVVILGVVGIVAFGSINSGLTSATDVAHITYLWRRGGWLSYFFAMSFALFFLLIFTTRLDAVLSSRTDLAAVPFSAVRPMQGSGLPPPNISFSSATRRRSWLGKVFGVFAALRAGWDAAMNWTTDRLEAWAAPKDDKQVAWTLGIGWACCGGGLAGGCLVFAKAT